MRRPGDLGTALVVTHLILTEAGQRHRRSARVLAVARAMTIDRRQGSAFNVIAHNATKTSTGSQEGSVHHGRPLSLGDRVDFPCGSEHLLLAFKARGDDEVVTGDQLRLATVGTTQNDPATEQLAKLVLCVTSLPTTRLSFPDSRKKLAVITGVVVPGALQGLTAHTAVIGSQVFLKLRSTFIKYEGLDHGVLTV